MFLTHLEDLSNEVIYEIFEFLDIYDIYQWFYNLNKRFRNLLTYLNLPIKINISSISKSNLHNFDKHIIMPHKHLITSLRLSNLFTIDLILSRISIFSKMLQLKTLILEGVESNYLEILLDHLVTLPELSSLVIIPIGDIRDENNLFQAIFRLPKLKYCKLTWKKCSTTEPLPIATDQYSPIEHLVIENVFDFEWLNALLTYVPQLRRLSCHHIFESRNKQPKMNLITLNHLTHLSLRIKDSVFNRFEQWIMNLNHRLEVLHISTCHSIFDLDANRWERLILSYIPKLRVFDIQFRGFLNLQGNQQTKCENVIRQFTTSFWFERQWLFSHQCCTIYETHYIGFYSINPYRRKSYALYGIANKNTCSRRQEIHLNFVNHIVIHDKKAVMYCRNYFPNVTDITILCSFHDGLNLITDNLFRILPLKKVTKLIIDCQQYYFEKVFQILSLLPNIQTLIIERMALHEIDLKSIQQNEILQSKSNKNKIINLTINHACTLNTIKLLVNRCPQLQCLSIEIVSEDIESILRLLLSKNDNNESRHLFSLCIKYTTVPMINRLTTLLKSEKLIDDYVLKFTGNDIHLWW